MDQSDAFSFPLTITRPELMVDGNDRQLRRLLYDITALAARIEQMRAEFAKRLEVSKPQYNILLHLAQHQGDTGRTVAQVAEALRVTGAHVTKETRLLIDQGLLVKHPNPEDGRSVLLMISPEAGRRITELSKVLRRVNDNLFATLSAEAFAQMSQHVHDTLNDAERTLRNLPFYLDDAAD